MAGCKFLIDELLAIATGSGTMIRHRWLMGRFEVLYNRDPNDVIL